MKSGNLNFLETSGPLQACNETALPLLHNSRLQKGETRQVPHSGPTNAASQRVIFSRHGKLAPETCVSFETETDVTFVLDETALRQVFPTQLRFLLWVIIPLSQSYKTE